MQARIRTFTLGIPAILLLLQASMARSEDAIAWQHDLEAAKKLAAESNRLILVHFYGSNCPPCVALDREVFSQKKAADAIQANYVPVKINVDHSLPLASQYGVQRWPTDVVLTPSGQVVTKFVSPQGMTAYLQRMDQVALASQASTSGQFAATGMNPYTGLGGKPSAPTTTSTTTSNVAAGTAPAGNMPPGGVGYGAAASTTGVNTAGYGAPADANRGQAQLVGNNAAVGDRYSSAAVGDRYAMPQNTLPPNPNPTQTTTGAGPSTYDRLAAQGPYAAELNPHAQSATPPANQFGQPVTPGYTDPYARPAGPQAPVTEPYAQQPAPQSQANPYAAAPPAGAGVPSAPGYGQNFAPQVGPMQGGPMQGAAPPASAPQMQTNPYAQQPADPAADPALEGRRNVKQMQAEPEFGLDGFCPVTLSKNQRWVKGDRKWGAIHMGRTYLFVGQAEQQEFLADPDRFSPVMAGNDPVLALETQLNVPGQRSFGVFYRNNVYLFSSEESLAKFSKTPDRYAAGVRQAMQARPTQRR